MLATKLLLRAAKRLQNAWANATTVSNRQLNHSLGLLDHAQRSFQVVHSRLVRTRQCNLTLIVPLLHRQIGSRAYALRQASDQVRALIEQPVVQLPSLGFFLAELRQMDADFDGLTIDWKTNAVSAATEPITLENVYLGPFAIRFVWERLAQAIDDHCFDIVALEPNPSGINDDVTHPHVKHKKLCPGDATVPLQKALQQGRLADAFSIVRSVLLTYNATSPHVPLDSWEGTTCHDCESSLPSEDLYYCEGCGHDYCDNCNGSCGVCDATRCNNCLERCEECETWCCQGCLEMIDDANYCKACRCSCAACGANFPKEPNNPEASLCSDCRQPPTVDDPDVAADEEPAAHSLPTESIDATTFPEPATTAQVSA